MCSFLDFRCSVLGLRCSVLDFRCSVLGVKSLPWGYFRQRGRATMSAQWQHLLVCVIIRWRDKDASEVLVQRRCMMTKRFKRFWTSLSLPLFSFQCPLCLLFLIVYLAFFFFFSYSSSSWFSFLPLLFPHISPLLLFFSLFGNSDVFTYFR